MAIKYQKIFQNATTISNDCVDVNGAESLKIGIFGSSTSFTVQFMASLDGTNFNKIAGTCETDGTTMSYITSTLGEAWSFDVSAYVTFRCDIIAIADGYLTLVINTEE